MAYKILLIDDSEVMRVKAAESLKQTTLDISEVLLAASAEEGLEKLAASANEPLDIVLCDRNMPGMDGLAFAREAALSSQTPVILLGSGRDGIEQAEAILAGAKAYIAKPFTREAITKAIRKVLVAA